VSFTVRRSAVVNRKQEKRVGAMGIRKFSWLCIFWTFLLPQIMPGFLQNVNAQALSPGNIAGVMTRWQTSTAVACERTYDGYANQPNCPRSLMFGITPDLDGLTLYQWVNSLALSGVNTGVIYVTPGVRLQTNPAIDQAEWAAYNQYIYWPPNSLNDNQKQVILQVGEAISKGEYTVAQRNYAIVAFLAALQSAFPNATPVKFILDERTWFIDQVPANGVLIPLRLSKVFSYEQAYSGDIAGIIQMASQQGLDNWLSGVRLSEYASKDWNLMGPVMIDLVTEINAKTSGWMKTHTFIGAGGGWGQDWKGVEAMQCPVTQGWQFAPFTGPLPFFNDMAPQVAYFAFGDKFMEFGKHQEYMLNGNPSGLEYIDITGEIADFCKENTRAYQCDDPAKPSVKDWEAFLDDDVDGLGFADLIDFLNSNAQAYPQLANVIFEGDNSDSLATMTLGKSANSEMALTQLFSNAAQGRYQDAETGIETDGTFGSWTGKIFIDAFDDVTSVPRPDFYGDKGYSLSDTNFNDFMFTPTSAQIIPRQKTMAIWSSWP
jgi:hypothetical protein